MALNFPSSPSTGQTHNATNGVSYYYDGVKWTSQGEYATGAVVQFILDDISGSFNGSTNTFDLHYNSSDVSLSSSLDVTISINGIIQEPTTSYTVNPTNSTITFNDPPTEGANFFGILRSKLPNVSVVPSDDTITTVKLQDEAVTAAKIGPQAVTAQKLGNGAVTSAKLDTDSVLTARIADGNVTSAKLETNISVAGTLAVAGKSTLTGGNVFPKVSSTLTSTALAVTSGWHEITADGNALTTLTGGTAGQTLLITVATTDLVVTDTAIGGGTNTIVGGVTLDVSEGDTLLLMFDGTQWRKIAHGDN
tara:strand:+ start:390 stop:1310 length:921 start_codon:yes stop_codon:yes gene_type:complete